MLENKERTLIYAACALIVIVFLIVLYNIWFPSGNNVDNLVNVYKYSDNYEIIRKNNYGNILTNLLRNESFGSLYKYINSDFLNINGLENQQEAYNYFQKNLLIGNNIEIGEITLTIKNDIYLYRVSYSSNDNSKYLTIVEYTPNNYIFDFSQNDIAAADEEFVIEKEDVLYTINLIGRTSDTIRMKIKIRNESPDKYIFDMADIFSVQLLVNGYEYINRASATVNSNNIYELNRNSEFEFEVIYNVPMSNQGNVMGIVFRNVDISGEKKNIEVLF